MTELEKILSGLKKISILRSSLRFFLFVQVRQVFTELFSMLDDEFLELLFRRDTRRIQRFPATIAPGCGGRIDVMAMRALAGCDLRLFLFRVRIHNAVNPRNLSVDIFTGQVSIGFKHSCIDRTPHHHLDDTFLDTIIYHVGDP